MKHLLYNIEKKVYEETLFSLPLPLPFFLDKYSEDTILFLLSITIFKVKFV